MDELANLNTNERKLDHQPERQKEMWEKEDGRRQTGTEWAGINKRRHYDYPENKMKEELVQTAKDKKPDQWADRAVQEGKTTVSLTPTTDAFHEVEHFPQDTPEQPHPNTPFFLPGGPGDLFKLVIHWGFIYTKWKCTTKVPGPKFCCFTQSAWRCKC